MSPAHPFPHRLAALRAALSENGLDGLLVPHSDEYLGEYTPACAERLAWLTGFTGSAGSAVVLATKAAVFSDGRYTTQMAQEVDASCWECQHSLNTPPASWLAANATPGSRIGYDPRIMSQSALAPFLSLPGLTLVPTAHNLIDTLWADRPSLPDAPAFIHPLDYAGEASLNKRAAIAAELSRIGQDAAVLSDSASIAWLLNIRGADIPCTPVILAFAVIHADATLDLFVSEAKIPPAVQAWLGPDVRLHAPEHMPAVLSALTARHIGVDPTSNAVWFKQVLETAGATVCPTPDPCLLPKARKNAIEQAGMRAAHLRDGVAVCRFLHWLDTQGQGCTELESVAQLEAFRAEHPLYRGDSFPTISGSGPNGAIIHYRVTAQSDRRLGENEVYLCDSGAQYPDGTTDITRTVWTGPGTPPDALRATFTRVLKGNLTLGHVRFPAGTTGTALDALARYALWQDALDYDHGTGHGVGSFLSVHEGPARIAKAPSAIALEAGMVLSNEPGFYLPGAYGIRLETLVMVRPLQHSQSLRAFLEFETLTLAPFDRRLIDPALLGAEDTSRLNAYHAQILGQIAPLLPQDAQNWLESACAPLNCP
ncbi:aminopeptidase P family protein [Acetobacter suratthaniensis]|uniref:Aminopeptidase P family protein n=1 Tax=Acetobacter suratthaniensis TaxID=1502841 RepID=A0ABS3LI81_9PROT|nr:aminopeptidase P family protein [Acetobacter suratthaniensis]MBO1327311.1 aminopeptidase P family protein [Acetobacter suratthaniensis]MCX2565076.1 aminopeptidase P family protein [Acetobacter suratthaniensis]